VQQRNGCTQGCATLKAINTSFHVLWKLARKLGLVSKLCQPGTRIVFTPFKVIQLVACGNSAIRSAVQGWGAFNQTRQELQPDHSLRSWPQIKTALTCRREQVYIYPDYELSDEMRQLQSGASHILFWGINVNKKVQRLLNLGSSSVQLWDESRINLRNPDQFVLPSLATASIIPLDRLALWLSSQSLEVHLVCHRIGKFTKAQRRPSNDANPAKMRPQPVL